MAQAFLEVPQAFLAEVEIVIAQCEGIVTQEAGEDQLRLSLEENREGGTGESISRIQEEGMGILLPNLSDQGGEPAHAPRLGSQIRVWEGGKVGVYVIGMQDGQGKGLGGESEAKAEER